MLSPVGKLNEHVEDMDRVERNRTIATEPPRQHDVLALFHLVPRGRPELTPIREVSIDRRARLSRAAAAISARLAEGDCASSRLAAPTMRSRLRSASLRRAVT